MSELDLSVAELELMTHALGLRNFSDKPYRNHFLTGGPMKEWNDLVSRGLAGTDGIVDRWGGQYFTVTDKGRQALKAYGWKSADKDRK